MINTEEDDMTGKPAPDDRGGLTAGEDIMLEILLRFAAMSLEQQGRCLTLIERTAASGLN